MKMRKTLFSLIVGASVFCMCLTPTLAATFKDGSVLRLEYHYIPLLEDKAIGEPAVADCRDDNSLALTTTVTAYNDSDSVTNEHTCTDFMFILEGWTSKTSCTAKIRSITFGEATFKVTDNRGSDSQFVRTMRD